MAEGLSNKHIALSLHISVKTVETHGEHDAEGEGATRRAERVRYAIRNSLVESQENLHGPDP